MTADDSRGNEPEIAPGPAGARPTPRRYLILLASAVFAALITIYFMPGGELDRIAFLERPVTSVTRVVERQLEIDDALAGAPHALRITARFTYDLTGRERERAIEAMLEVLRSIRRRASAADAQAEPGESPGKTGSDAVRELEALSELQARLAVLQFEAGRADEARFVLEELEREGGAGELAAAIRRAYLPSGSNGGRAFESYDLTALEPGWTADRLRLALARAMNAEPALERIDAEVRARLAGVRERAVRTCIALNVPIAVGILLLLAWIWRNHPDLGLGDASIPPPWTWAEGLSVLVRSALSGIAVWFVLGLLDLQLETRVFSLWATLIASVPMLWFIRKRLLTPSRIGFSRAFGFGSALSRPSMLAATALAVLALDRLGGSAIQVLSANFGENPHWTELAPEEWIWAPTAIVLLGAADLVLFAPILEEIGCRGLLYGSLRRRVGPWTAAIFSAGLFGLVHPYSTAGLAQALWTGFVYALAYERTKSLAPVCASHALHNLFALVAGWTLYR